MARRILSIAWLAANIAAGVGVLYIFVDAAQLEIEQTESATIIAAAFMAYLCLSCLIGIGIATWIAHCRDNRR